jgi:uncharacterized cysteine cluster protein YcgN (CxxCxxCC family)
MSCHTPIQLGMQTVIIPEIHCRFLERDADGRSACAVYEHRHEIAPWCRTASEAIGMQALAHDCPYAAGVPGFKGKRWAKDWEHEAIAQALRDKLTTEGLTIEDSPDAALRLFGEGWTYEESEDGTHNLFRRLGQ